MPVTEHLIVPGFLGPEGAKIQNPAIKLLIQFLRTESLELPTQHTELIFGALLHGLRYPRREESSGLRTGSESRALSFPAILPSSRASWSDIGGRAAVVLDHTLDGQALHNQSKQHGPGCNGDELVLVSERLGQCKRDRSAIHRAGHPST